MSKLLDANVLVALLLDQHIHHLAAHAWLARQEEAIATCPITEGALVRLTFQQGGSAEAALRLLQRIHVQPRYEFWPDDVSYLDVPLGSVIGHRQVTDAYLAGLARHRGGRLATFDRGLAATYPDVVELVPTR